MVTHNTSSVSNADCSQFALAGQFKLRLAQARKQVDKLTPSLLARAFAGQLVPQNPADEPAEQLLKRVNRNHESKSQPK